VYEVFPARPPRHRLSQQTCMPQMPPNPRPEQMRSRRLNLSPLRRSPRPHDSNKPPRGNLGPGHRAHRTRRTINQRETNHRFCHKNPLRPVPPSAPQNS
jgi:hypothetical protein